MSRASNCNSLRVTHLAVAECQQIKWTLYSDDAHELTASNLVKQSRYAQADTDTSTVIKKNKIEPTETQLPTHPPKRWKIVGRSATPIVGTISTNIIQKTFKKLEKKILAFYYEKNILFSTFIDQCFCLKHWINKQIL